MTIWSQIQKIQFLTLFRNDRFHRSKNISTITIQIPKRQILKNGQRVTDVLQVTYSVNGDGGYVADVSYTGEAQVMFFSVSYLYFINYIGGAQMRFHQSNPLNILISAFYLSSSFFFIPHHIVTVISAFFYHTYLR